MVSSVVYSHTRKSITHGSGDPGVMRCIFGADGSAECGERCIRRGSAWWRWLAGAFGCRNGDEDDQPTGQNPTLELAPVSPADRSKPWERHASHAALQSSVRIRPKVGSWFERRERLPGSGTTVDANRRIRSRSMRAVELNRRPARRREIFQVLVRVVSASVVSERKIAAALTDIMAPAMADAARLRTITALLAALAAGIQVYNWLRDRGSLSLVGAALSLLVVYLVLTTPRR